MAKTKTESTTETALSLIEQPARELTVMVEQSVFEEFANAGFENVKSSDILIPRITILQDKSPQVLEEAPEHIEGAKRGLICDVGTGRLIGETMIFVPVHFSKVWLEWYPRESQKGLATIHTSPAILDDCTLDERNRPTLRNGNYIAETAQLFGLNVTIDGQCNQVYIPFTSTQLKKCRRLLTLAMDERIQTSKGEITPPLFYRSYVLSTLIERKNKDSWFGWKIERGSQILEFQNGRSILAAAIKMRSQIADGAIKADITGDEAIDNVSAARYEEHM